MESLTKWFPKSAEWAVWRVYIYLIANSIF